jgi:hypothetical protein
MNLPRLAASACVESGVPDLCTGSNTSTAETSNAGMKIALANEKPIKRDKRVYRYNFTRRVTD